MNYWKNRFDQIEQQANNKSADYIHELDRKYRTAIKDIDDNIRAWMSRFAKNNNMSMNEARKLLNKGELDEFKWTIQDYISKGKQNKLNGQWTKQLENVSARVHISRLEALQIDIKQKLYLLTDGLVGDVSTVMSNVYTDAYYHSCYEIEKGVGIGVNVASVNEKELTLLLEKPWSVTGKNFSENLWENKTKLINVIDQELTRLCLTGESPAKTIDRITKQMNTSKANVARLVLTEQAYFTTLAQENCYKALGVEEIEIVATLDGVTCDECGQHDKIHFPRKDMEAGINAPPFHPYCRCTTAPYFDDEFDISKRWTETGYVDSKMTYSEWYEKYVQ